MPLADGRLPFRLFLGLCGLEQRELALELGREPGGDGKGRCAEFSPSSSLLMLLLLDIS
jgi:hypothetical protein